MSRTICKNYTTNHSKNNTTGNNQTIQQNMKTTFHIISLRRLYNVVDFLSDIFSLFFSCFCLVF